MRRRHLVPALVLTALAVLAPAAPAADAPASRAPTPATFSLGLADLLGDLPVGPAPETVPGPPSDELLEPAPLADEAADPDEPPLLARPDATVHPYGEAVPRITCIPYRACTLLLHPDETVRHLALGDTERWQVETFASAGTAPALVFKPVAANLLTNLVIKTDRRLYVLELLSPAPEATDPRSADVAYDALTTFRYPHRWARSAPAPSPPSETSEQPAADPAGTQTGPESPDSAPEPPATDPEALHFDYSFDRPLWPKHRLPWEPDVVYDDGTRTFIHLPAEAHRHDLPAVLRVTGSGEPAPLDATLTGPQRSWLLVPAVAPRLRLVTRDGDTTRRLTLVRSR